MALAHDPEPTARFRPAANVYARPFGEELVLLEFGRGEYFALDEVGALVWRGLEGDHDLRAVAGDIARTYDIDVATALADIFVLVRELVDHALLEPISGNV